MAAPILRNSNADFFLARAEQARVEGEEAMLDHVRARYRRSEAAWTALADRAQRLEQLQIEEKERKAGKQSA